MSGYQNPEMERVSLVSWRGPPNRSCEPPRGETASLMPSPPFLPSLLVLPISRSRLEGREQGSPLIQPQRPQNRVEKGRRVELEDTQNINIILRKPINI